MRWRKAGTRPGPTGPSSTSRAGHRRALRQHAKRPDADTAYEYQACGKEQSYSDYVCVGPEGKANAVDTFTTSGQSASRPASRSRPSSAA